MVRFSAKIQIETQCCAMPFRFMAALLFKSVMRFEAGSYVGHSPVHTRAYIQSTSI